PRSLIILTMSLAGLLAGAAGAVTVLGVTRNMAASFVTTVGFDSIAVARLARPSPVGIIFSALLFGSLRSGAAQTQIHIRLPADPIAFAALCGVMGERSGVVNIGIEGIMIAAAFTGWYAGVLMGPSATDSTPVFGASPALIVADVVAVATGVLISLLHAW